MLGAKEVFNPEISRMICLYTHVRFVEVRIQAEEYYMRTGFAEVTFLGGVGPYVGMAAPLAIHLVTAILVSRAGVSVALSCVMRLPELCK